MLTGNCHCGATKWRYTADPTQATACNCTVCAKAGTLWIHGTEGDTIHITGPTTAYKRADAGTLEFLHCPTCGNTIGWRLVDPDQNTAAVNLRLADTPDDVMHLPIRHFDGLHSFAPLPDDRKTVKDLWF